MNTLPDGQNPSPQNKAPTRFSELHADFHLTSQERRIVSEAYRANEEALLRATRGNLRSFISKDYGAANFEALGGTDGIKKLQKALKIKEDGYFGPATFQALIAFQESHGLKTDAIAGPETRAKLGISGIENARTDAPSTGDKLPNETEWQHTPSHTLPSPSTSIQTEKAGLPPVPQPTEPEKDTSPALSETRAEAAKSAGVSGWKTVFHSMSMQDMRPDEGFLIWSAKHAIRRSTGVLEGVGAVISGLEDLTAFVYEYGKSLIWKNPERKKQMDEQMEEIWGSIKWTEFQGMPDRVMEAIGKEILRIYLLPSDEQDVAIGMLAGSTIGTLGVIKTGAITGKLIADTSKKSAQVIRINTGLAKRGMETFTRTARVKTLETRVKLAQYTAGSLDVVINGFAESTLSYGLQKSIRWIAALLKSSKSTAEKMQAVDRWIHETDEALKNSREPEQQAKIEEVREVLETEKEHLIKQTAPEAAKPVDAPVARKPKTNTRHQSVQDTPRSDNVVAFRPKKPQSETITTKEEVPTSQKEPPIRKPVGSRPKQRTSPEQKSEEKLNSQEKPSIPSNPPKSFDITWMSSRKLYRTLAQYYHTDRNAHPQAEAIFKKMKEFYEKDDIEWLRSIAKDPEGYIKKRGWSGNAFAWKQDSREKTRTVSQEQFMRDIREYAEKYSEAQLQQLARTNHRALGSALLYRQTYREISDMAKTNMARAVRSLDAFHANPDKYLGQRYPEPFTSVALEIQKLSREYIRVQKARDFRRAA